MVEAIEDADEALGKLIAGLQKREVFDSIDIILVYPLSPRSPRLSSGKTPSLHLMTAVRRGVTGPTTA